MKRYTQLLKVKALFFGFSALLLLASCGSYQYAGYDNDGIYSSDRDEAYTANEYEESYENALYYKQLFGEKSEEFASVPEEGAIFTDIDSYSSGAYQDPYVQEDLNYEPGAAWGTDPDEISINIYQDQFYNPFYNPYVNPYYAGLYYPYWSYYGHPYNPYYYGHASWRYGVGFGWNHWRYGYSPYYTGYNYPYYGHRYYGDYERYDRRNVAYSSSRRNSYPDNNDYVRVRSDRSSRVQGYSDSRSVRTVARSNSDRRTYGKRSTRVRSSESPERRRSAYYRSSGSDYERAARSNRSRRSSVQTRSSRTYEPRVQVRSSRSSSSSQPRSSSRSSSSRGRGNQ